jgi:hypothetical protein
MYADLSILVTGKKFILYVHAQELCIPYMITSSTIIFTRDPTKKSEEIDQDKDFG